MFKHRDNIQFNPTTIDPSGSGHTTTAAPATPSPVSAPQAAPFSGDVSTPTPATAAGRKRPRDIRGIDRFRQVIFGERGFMRLHGMVSRAPMLMYPPEGIDAARRRVARRREADERKAAAALADEELWGLFEERRRAEADDASPPDAEDDTPGQRARDAELAQYHHKQLDAFLKLFYEFNHTTFVRLSVPDTLQLISRCGKEAVAHVMEYESHSRLLRDAMVKELRDLHDEESRLKRRREAIDAAEEARALMEAECVDDDMDAFLERMAREQLEAAEAEKNRLDDLALSVPLAEREEADQIREDMHPPSQDDAGGFAQQTGGGELHAVGLSASSSPPCTSTSPPQGTSPRRSVRFTEPLQDAFEAESQSPKATAGSEETTVAVSATMLDAQTVENVTSPAADSDETLEQRDSNAEEV